MKGAEKADTPAQKGKYNSYEPVEYYVQSADSGRMILRDNPYPHAVREREEDALQIDEVEELLIKSVCLCRRGRASSY